MVCKIFACTCTFYCRALHFHALDIPRMVVLIVRSYSWQLSPGFRTEFLLAQAAPCCTPLHGDLTPPASRTSLLPPAVCIRWALASTPPHPAAPCPTLSPWASAPTTPCHVGAVTEPCAIGCNYCTHTSTFRAVVTCRKTRPRCSTTTCMAPQHCSSPQSRTCTRSNGAVAIALSAGHQHCTKPCRQDPC